MASNDERSSHNAATDLGKEPARLIKNLATKSQKLEVKSESLPLAQALKGSKGKGSSLSFQSR